MMYDISFILHTPTSIPWCFLKIDNASVEGMRRIKLPIDGAGKAYV